MKYGEVWTVVLPPTAGHEQSGQRPCLVIQDDRYGRRSPLVLMVPLTSRRDALCFPATVQVEPTPQNGLSLTSVALVFQTRATERSLFVRHLGLMSEEDTARILAELNRLTGQQ